MVADNAVAIIGGRNIGDEYFDAKEDNNFRDLDVIAIGPVVPAATASFEAYWNSDAARPISEFHSASDSPTSHDAPVAADVRTADRASRTVAPAAASAVAAPKASADPVEERAILEKNARTFEQSAYKEAAADDLPNGASADRPGNWYWGPANLVADQPEKIDASADRSDLRITPQLKGMIKQAQSEVLVISPYFVPSGNDDTNFVTVAQRGVAFEVLTNSLGSTDELAVYNGYAAHRRKLLEGGVQLYELKPAPGVEMAASDAGQSSGVSLHAKALVVDHRYVFIGSLNMDRRSKVLNTEMGVVVDSPQLAKAVDEFFRTATQPANAYHVVLGSPGGSDRSNLHWEYSENGKDIDADKEPGVSLGRHLKSTLMKILPIDGLL
jgi:putative cardiolipin synthase